MKSIRSRLLLVLAFVEAMTLSMALVLYVGAGRLDEGATRTREANDEVRDLLAFALLAHGYMNAFGESLGQRTLIANHDRRAAASAFEVRIARVGTADRGGSQLSTDQWKELRGISGDLQRELKIADDLREKGNFFDAERVFRQARRSQFHERMLPWFDRAIETLRSEVGDRETSSMASARELRIAGNVLGCLSVGVAIFAVVALSRTILHPVKLLARGAEALGRGDLSYRVAYEGENELGLLANRFNVMADTVASTQSALLERNARLEEAYQLQSDFLSMVSHELRSPLHSIVGYTELVLEDEAGLAEQSRKNMSNIAIGARRLLSLINDILDFSRLKAGRMEALVQPVDLRPLLESVRDDAGVISRGRPIDIVIDAPVDPVVLKSDEAKLRQILTNLVTNAVKFTDEGVVTLKAASVDGGLEFRVIDTGIGIPADQLGVIFEPFRQAKGAGKQGGGGTGLGLAIVARLTKLLGGRISVESKVGQGTMFTVFFPT
jgi:signal transduction histidine kinase